MDKRFAVVPRLCSERHSSATSTMTETGLSRKPWKTEQITGTFPSNSFAPSQMPFPETSESEFFSELPSARTEPPQGRAATPKQPRSGPVSRYPLGIPTPSPSSSRVVDKEGRIIAPSSSEIVANTAGVGGTTIESTLEPPTGLSNCIVGPLWACFISDILNNRGSLSTDQVRSEISKHFPTRYDLNTHKDDPYGWQSQVWRVLRSYCHFVHSNETGLWRVEQSLADRTRSRPGVHGTLKENTADGFPPQDCAAVFDYYYMEFQY